MSASQTPITSAPEVLSTDELSTISGGVALVTGRTLHAGCLSGGLRSVIADPRINVMLQGVLSNPINQVGGVKI